VSFKFRLCEEVKTIGDTTGETYQVIALLLHGFVKVRSLTTRLPLIVKEDTLEEVNRPE
jgi:hypothetical protein